MHLVVDISAHGYGHLSLTAPACVAVITGLGLEGYYAAVRFLIKQ